MTHLHTARLLLPAIGAALCAHAASAQTYTFTTLDVPGQTLTQTTGTPSSLNDHDVVVGSTFNSQQSQYQGFAWQAGNFTLYPSCHILVGINDKGLAVGYASIGGGYCTVDTHTGQVKSFAVHAHGNLGLQGINQSAAVVATIEGSNQITRGLLLEGHSTTVLQAPGSANKYGGTYPSGINDAGTVVGYYSDTAGVVHGFTALNGSFASFDVPGGTGTYPYVITASGDVGGGFLTHGSGGTTVGFVRIGGVYSTILPPGATGSYVNGIGPGGEIVGGYVDAASAYHGFVDRGGSFVQIDVAGASYTTINSVNALGSLAGSFRDQNGDSHPFIAQCAMGQVCTP